jgi:hypothetical protein
MQYLNAKARGRVGSDQFKTGQESKLMSPVGELSIEELKARIEEVVEEKLRGT